MPLIIITGHPSSGKTHRAHQLLTDFQSRIAQSTSEETQKLSVTLLPSRHSSLDPPIATSSGHETYKPPSQDTNPRDQIYNLAAREKTARAEEFSAIKRAVSKNNVVIADGLNYIKGFRYQLWCEAKAARTRCVVVHVAAREDECEAWNTQRLKAWAWETSESAETASNIKGPKLGKDFIGGLDPTSHTAIYGDRVPQYSAATRSRSSSMDGGLSSDDGLEGGNLKQVMNDQDQSQSKLVDETMTLKSLYIVDRADTVESLQQRNEKLELDSVGSQASMPQNTASPDPPSPRNSLPYQPSTLKSLLMRYEPPSPFTRWDTPLFTVPSVDVHPPYDSVWTAIFPPSQKAESRKGQSQSQPQPHFQNGENGRNSDIASSTRNGSTPTKRQDEVRPNAATVLPQATSSEALQILESGTADVVRALLVSAREQNLANGEGGTLTFDVPYTVTTTTTTTPPPTHAIAGTPARLQLTCDLPMNSPLSQPMLQRLRRKYTQIQRGSIAHGQGHASGREEVVRGFTDFLNAEWAE